MAVISPWDIYWVLQLDSINAAIATLAVGCGVAAAGGLFIMAMATNRGLPILQREGDDEAWAKSKKIAARLVAACAAFTLISAFLPSTRTAAAMFIIPAVANNETIQQEAGDLYKLAKEALANAVKPDAPKEPAK